LGKILYQAVAGMIRINEASHELYHYYRFRAKNQLTGKQAIIFQANKLIRIIRTMVMTKVDYDEAKMLGAIKHPDEFLFVA
jgi:transposase